MEVGGNAGLVRLAAAQLREHRQGQIGSHQQAFAERYEAVIAAGAIPLKPGVEALFARLDEIGLRRVVATSTRRSRALPKLEATGLLVGWAVSLVVHRTPRIR